ncbi:T9SS type A sorting domain-containing protein [Thalassobellus suaedae]|uniref:T9SS type A sorting domain-containing protein n=1 Tax=Thalassobellus suaedae TaxID=3074124 RepID=A0ABY9XYH3_9FLAO|nr:T9SS type A sorting domain-containing protein [Flavobacteriaceae bacterium HL-DH14]
MTNTESSDAFNLFDINGRHIKLIDIQYSENLKATILKFPNTITTGVYILKINNNSKKLAFTN